jgi:cytochrome b6-f complex iron-sulfur subunit
MTTPTVKGKAASAQAPAAKAASAAENTVKPINRREFLYYIWGASMAVLLAEGAGAIIWFALPRFREGEYGGVFRLDPSLIPPAGSAPVRYPAGKFWLSNTSEGLLAISMVCTHLGCLFAWVPTNDRFECPCHGSKFQLNGKYIEGPAPRSLDRFALTVDTASGSAQTNAAGDPVKADGATQIAVNTGKKIKGETHG